MSELADIQEEKVTIKIGGRERELRFNFSAWAKIEKELGGLDKIDKLQEDIEKKPFETIPKLLYIGLVDKEGVTSENVLDEYGLKDVQYISEQFTKAIFNSLPQADEKKAEAEA